MPEESDRHVTMRLHSSKKQDPMWALTTQRDLWLSRQKSDPEGAGEAMERLRIECVMETLRLTGMPVSLREVAREAESMADVKRSPKANLISGQFRALHAIETSAHVQTSLPLALVCEVHRLSSPPAGGVFRRGPGSPQFAGAKPCRPELVAEQVSNLVGWLAADSGRDLKLPEKAALAFVRLLEISPFDGGNYRTAHLLLSFFAFADGYPPLFFGAEEADEIRGDVERALAIDTLPLVTRLARAQAKSLSFCLEVRNRP